MTKYLDWAVGDFVVRTSPKLNEEVEGKFNEKFPDVGKVYTIRSFLISKNDKVCIRLVEIVNPVLRYRGYSESLECGFRAEYFRKLSPKGISVFTEILNKEKDKMYV